MLEPLNFYFPFKKHPELERINRFFRSRKVKKVVQDILKNNIRYLYPRILSISLEKYPDYLKDYELHPWENKDFKKRANFEEADRSISIQPLSKHILECITYLREYCDSNKSDLIIVCDLRISSYIDRSILVVFLEGIFRKTSPLIVLYPESIKSIIDDLSVERKDSKWNVIFFDSTIKLFNYIETYINKDENALKIILPEKLTIASFGECLNSNNFRKKVKTKFLIELDFYKTHYINPFVLFLLNNLIRSYSAQYGLRWKFSNISKREKLFLLFENFKILSVNSFFLNSDHSVEKLIEEKNLRQLGVYLFNERTRNAINQKFNDFLNDLVKMFPNYLNQRAAITYESAYKSYKPCKRYFSYHNYIRMIVSELVENVTLHSNGTGYFASELKNYILFIYIGDCGIGIHKGILQNYKLDHLFKSTEDSLRNLFRLDEHNDKRMDSKTFSKGAGFGLKDTLNNIFRLKGKIVYRSGEYFGAYLNPVKKASAPPNIFRSNTNIRGTQYMIMIPMSKLAIQKLPANKDNFLSFQEK
jgi:hypothetical protein